MVDNFNDGNDKSRVRVRLDIPVVDQGNVELPFKTLALAPWSLESSDDAQKGFSEREPKDVSTIDKLNREMKNLNMSIALEVDNKVEQNVKNMRVEIPITSMDSFSPEEVASNVPQIRKLINIKKMLRTLMQEINNNPAQSETLAKFWEENIGEIKEEFAHLKSAGQQEKDGNPEETDE